MKNVESDNFEKTAFFMTAILSSLTIQLLAQGFYPTFEDQAIEFYQQRDEDDQAID